MLYFSHPSLNPKYHPSNPRVELVPREPPFVLGAHDALGCSDAHPVLVGQKPDHGVQLLAPDLATPVVEVLAAADVLDPEYELDGLLYLHGR
jgi:hypothetical protein